MRVDLPIAQLPIALLLLAGCSSHASKQDQLNSAANESTPEAANILTGAARDGTTSRKKETQPDTGTIVNRPQPAEPSREPGTSNSD